MFRPFACFAFCFALLATHSALGTLGFKLPSDPSLPAQVKAASSSVLRIVPFLDEPRVIKKEGYAEARNLFKERQGFMADWFTNMLDECIKKGQEECSFPFSAAATAFVAESADTIYTSIHNFADLFKAVGELLEEQDALGKWKIAKTIVGRKFNFLLIDTERGKNVVVYDSRQPNTGAKAEQFIMSPLIPLIAKVEVREEDRFMLKTVGDYLRLKLDRPLETRPLKIHATREGDKFMGKTVYAVGYPERTSNRLALMADDSDGHHKYITSGEVISFADTTTPPLIRMGQSKDERAYMAAHVALIDSLSLSSNADVAQGMSGGPMLLESGEVLTVVPLAKPLKPPANQSYTVSTSPVIFSKRAALTVDQFVNALKP
jgi:hypothetical protein